MADDDFDIDIYGDTNTELDGMFRKDDEGDVNINGFDGTVDDTIHANGKEGSEEYIEIKVGSKDHAQLQEQQQIKSTDEPSHDLLTIPKRSPQQQGVKRKEGSDERPIDPGATTALLISDLHWWNTDDDIRGWINQAQCEDELKEVTFSEHKINGKSKGQAYVEFTSQQAATAAKHKIDDFGIGQQTLPKDAPIRDSKGSQNNHSSAGAYNNRNGQTNNFRGRGSGYSANRGNMGNNAGGNFNRNFSGSQMNSITSGFQPSMGGFQGNQMGGSYGGYNRGGMVSGMRGGSSNMRGGRVGMGNAMLIGMPMGGMSMGAMGGAMAGMAGMAAPMGMSQMGGGMPGTGFQGLQPHFNPAFFQQNQPVGGDWQNPHGAKRQRPE